VSSADADFRTHGGRLLVIRVTVGQGMDGTMVGTTIPARTDFLRSTFGSCPEAFYLIALVAWLVKL